MCTDDWVLPHGRWTIEVKTEGRTIVKCDHNGSLSNDSQITDQDTSTIRAGIEMLIRWFGAELGGAPLPECHQADIADYVASMPNKTRYNVSELVDALCYVLDISRGAALNRVYTAMQQDRLEARKHLGTWRIPRSEVLRILYGEKAI